MDQSHNRIDPRFIEFAKLLARRAAQRDHDAAMKHNKHSQLNGELYD